MKIKKAAVIVALLGCLSICSATTFMELESSYLGDGWFRYRMKIPHDPFFRKADVGDFVITSFTNFAEFGPAPQDWTNQPPSGNTAPWHYQLSMPSQTRPYEREFLVRSSERNYRVATNALVIFSLELNSDWLDYWRRQGAIAGNIVGYANLPCLIPCPPGATGNSPSNYTYNFSIIDHDMTLDSLVVTNGLVTGVTFSAGFKSTVLLEGSMDYSQWTRIAYIWGNQGTTTWTTNVPLNDFGQFFRLQLVAMDEHVTNLPPLSTMSATTAAYRQSMPALPTVPESEVTLLDVRPQGEVVSVQFHSESGRVYVVEASDGKGKVVNSQTMAGNGGRVEVLFDAATLPNPVFFSAKLVP